MADVRRGPKAVDRAAGQALPGRPEPPDDLDVVAAAHWAELVELVDEAGLLSRLDRDCLEAYCRLWSTWRFASEQCKGDARIITAPNKYRQVNPWYTIAAGALKDMKWFLNQLGLTPAARRKLAVAEPEEADPKWADF